MIALLTRFRKSRGSLVYFKLVQLWTKQLLHTCRAGDILGMNKTEIGPIHVFDKIEDSNPELGGVRNGAKEIGILRLIAQGFSSCRILITKNTYVWMFDIRKNSVVIRSCTFFFFHCCYWYKEFGCDFLPDEKEHWGTASFAVIRAEYAVMPEYKSPITALERKKRHQHNIKWMIVFFYIPIVSE